MAHLPLRREALATLKTPRRDARGIEVLESALVGAGGTRFGEVGRHDAATGESPVAAVRSWADSVAEFRPAPARPVRRGR